MFTHIFSLLIEVLASVVAAAALLRLYLQFHFIPLSIKSGNPFAPFVFVTTNWLVMPLRKVLPSWGRFDMSSFVAAFLVMIIKCVALAAVGVLSNEPLALALDAIYALLSLILSCLSSLTIAYALLSWIQRDSPVFDLMSRMILPLLAPIRRRIPPLGGLDISVFVLLILLQILEIVLRDGHVYLLRWVWSA
jgi:YggT family protein